METRSLIDIDHEKQLSVTQLVDAQYDGESNGVSINKMPSTESEFEEPEVEEGKYTTANVQTVKTANLPTSPGNVTQNLICHVLVFEGDLQNLLNNFQCQRPKAISPRWKNGLENISRSLHSTCA